MTVKTVDWVDGKMRIVEQTKLPEELVYLDCGTLEEVCQAIKRLAVRGAPAIGIAGAMGVVVGVKESKAGDYESFMEELKEVARYLGTSRPTAVNLFWALDRMVKTAERNRTDDIPKLKKILETEALRILDEDNETCLRLGKYGAALLGEGSSVLTHCNAGGLATGMFGTALSCIFVAHEEGKKIHVFVDETRPLLQGARLTAWELVHAGIDATLISDNMAAKVMQEGRVDIIITGADRIAANGDTANKIGTYGLAQLARAHNIPFYIAAPLSTVDLSIASGEQIPIEERDPDEVRRIGDRWIAPREVKVYNPAFDVTPAGLIHGIITEAGIIRPPYDKNLPAAFNNRNNSATKARRHKVK